MGIMVRVRLIVSARVGIVFFERQLGPCDGKQVANESMQEHVVPHSQAMVLRHLLPEGVPCGIFCSWGEYWRSV